MGVLCQTIFPGEKFEGGAKGKGKSKKKTGWIAAALGINFAGMTTADLIGFVLAGREERSGFTRRCYCLGHESAGGGGARHTNGGQAHHKDGG